MHALSGLCTSKHGRTFLGEPLQQNEVNQKSKKRSEFVSCNLAMYQPISPFIFQRPKKMTEVSLFFPVPFYQNALYLRAPHRLFPLGG